MSANRRFDGVDGVVEFHCPMRGSGSDEETNDARLLMGTYVSYYIT